jgi:hypothetical protein
MVANAIHQAVQWCMVLTARLYEEHMKMKYSKLITNVNTEISHSGHPQLPLVNGCKV